MRKILVLILAVLGCQLSVYCGQLLAAPKIIAVVNNDAITEKDLDDAFRIFRVQLSRQFEGKELEDKIKEMKKDLLERIIEGRLMFQEGTQMLEEARKNKDAYAMFRLEIKSDQVKTKIKEMKKSYPSDVEFENDLKKEGITQADVESKIREQIMTDNVIDYWVRGQVKIRPDEVTDFYNKNSKDFDTGEDRELLVVTLENEDLAKSLSYNLRTGQKIEDLATRYSFNVNTLTANKNKGELRKDIEDVAFKLGLNEVTNPVKIEDKYYVFVLQNITPSRKLVLSEVQSKVYNYLYRIKMQEEMTKWLDELKKKAYIKIS
ncbi:MAG: peptidyl-prolyl cis-trans isomerase [Candidatus Omnitrophica bacterium]|nr:peptidyl-prolyl cis-trans isomerase [Candidatus Omnitrophota bacterium]